MGIDWFPQRHPGYRIGVVCELIGLLVFVLGFGAQYWTSSTKQVALVTGGYDEYDVFNGLWGICYRVPAKKATFNADNCFLVTKVPEYDTAWFKAVQALQCLALIVAVAAAGLAIFMQMTYRRFQLHQMPFVGRLVEILAIASALLGTTGIAVYGGMHPGYMPDPVGLLEGASVEEVTVFNWAFVVDVIGLGVIMFSGVFMAIFNRREEENRPDDWEAVVDPAYGEEKVVVHM